MKPAPETITLNTRHSQGEARLEWGRYENRRIALRLLDAETREPLCVATVNMPEFGLLARGETIIKTWSENEGVLQSLVDAGIVEDTDGRIPVGFVKAAVCRWTVEIPEFA